MIPVTLRLANFLSYGTEAPALDFEQFHVACLSGKNGQGKSALLDAITWALWGEARKSSDSRKPDDELIRIGTRHMEVELVFDLEGDRYRVVRSYQRSASGKTSKPGLEVAVYEPGTDAYRPLTGASLRETQAHLDALLGIDYDTFINSAFLLQGRSDEFTKKKPSERKQILSRILNLSRFDRLADLARARQREAEDRLRAAEAEIERLTTALEREPGWKEERDEVEEAIAAEETRLATARDEERRLAEQLAALDERAREADAMRRRRDELDARRKELAAEADDLRARIETADALIARRDAIRRDFERRVALDRERDELETKSQLHRGVEKQIEAKEAELKDRRNEMEKRLHATEVELRNAQREHARTEAQLTEEPALRRALASARAARREVETLEARRAERKEREEACAVFKETLLSQREALRGRLRAAEEAITADRAALEDREALTAEAARFREQVRCLEEARERLDAISLKGQTVAEELRELSGQHKHQKEALATLVARIDRFESVGESVCPTCGIELSDARRDEVSAHYAEEVARLEAGLQETEAAMAARRPRREGLGEQYRATQLEIKRHEEVPERLAALNQRIEADAARRARLGEQEAAAAELRRRIEEKDYAREERGRYVELRRALDAAPFDETAFDRLREQAAQCERYTERLADVEEARGRREALANTIRQHEAAAARLHEGLDEGTPFAGVREAIEALRGQLADVGYDGERHTAVRVALADLADAGARFRDLENAQQNRADWSAALERNTRQADEVQAARARLADSLSALEEALAARPTVASELAARAARRGELDASLSRRKILLGELQARLETAARDREALKAQRAAHGGAKRERNLYKHLKTAFGRHGIPSLIIEQTLPEIEERANTLLERLTDGRMHVRLETLKDKKTGGTKETLDIIITDEQGAPRAYETFSGGEAFRVNFALRIALAQLLAERSGVRVRTLVVDEGFGTQDAQGVQNMVEAIQTIQEDFDKIVVITHLAELKEAFPVRIEVEKHPVDGSSFEVLGV